MQKSGVLTTDERLEVIERNIKQMNAMLYQLLQQKNDGDSSKGEVIMNVKEAAAFLGIEKHIVYAKCAVGEIPCFRVGKLYKFRKLELKKWLQEQGAGDEIDVEAIANRYLQKHVLKG
jgi:excisionase family DNA binding protein